MKTRRENSSASRPGARPRLFISYRRRFDNASARLLKAELTKAFSEGAVFRDVDDIEPGAAFPETIREAVESSDVFLPLVSPGWVEVSGELRDPADFVRREIAAALARGVTLVPVLLGGAQMPEPSDLPEEVRELASRQAVELSDTRWDYDVQRLVEVIRSYAAPADEAVGRVGTSRPAFATRPAVLGVAALLAAAAFAAYTYLSAKPPLPVEPPLTYAECLKRLRAGDAKQPQASPIHKATVGAQEKPAEGEPEGQPIVGVDEYKLVSPPPAEGLPILVELTDGGRDVGAVSLRFLRGPYPEGGVVFKVDRVVEPPCAEVTDYYNKDGKAKSEVYNWNGLSVRLGGRDYRLRLGDHGDTLNATLTRAAGR